MTDFRWLASLRTVLEFALSHFRELLIGGIVVVIVLGRIDRLWGASLGLLYCLVVAVLGAQVYARGGAVGLAVFPLPEVGFYLLIVFLTAIQLASLRQGLLARATARRREFSDSGGAD